MLPTADTVVGAMMLDLTLRPTASSTAKARAYFGRLKAPELLSAY